MLNLLINTLKFIRKNKQENKDIVLLKETKTKIEIAHNRELSEVSAWELTF